jgi:MFS family permease
MYSGFAAGWRQVVACLLMMAAAAMITSGYGVLAVPLGAEFQPTRMVLMLAMTIMMLVSGLVSPVFGTLMDRFPLRLLMGCGAALVVTGFVALSFATSFLQVLVIYALFMAPANVLIGPMPATVLLSRWFVRRRGTALGIAIAGVSLGGFAYPPIAQALLDSHDWRTAVRLLAVIVALTLLPAVLCIVNRPADRGLHPDGAASDPDGAPGQAAPAHLPLRALLGDSTFWILAVVFGVVMAGMTGMVTNLVPLAVDEGIDPSVATLLISIYAGAGFLAKLAFAAVADRLPPRLLILIAVTGFAAGMACVIGAELGYAMIALGVGLIGLFGGLMVPLQGFLVPRIFGQHVVGRVSGILSFVVLLGLLATPPVFGLVFDVTGNYDAGFLAVALLAMGTMLLVPYLRVQPEAAARAEAAGAV